MVGIQWCAGHGSVQAQEDVHAPLSGLGMVFTKPEALLRIFVIYMGFSIMVTPIYFPTTNNETMTRYALIQHPELHRTMRSWMSE